MPSLLYYMAEAALVGDVMGGPGYFRWMADKMEALVDALEETRNHVVCKASQLHSFNSISDQHYVCMSTSYKSVY
jgi:hypothetical protein